MPLLPFALALAARLAQAPPPTVAVEVGVDPGLDPSHARARELEGLVTWRMLDEGLRVVGARDAAQLTVEVHVHETSAQVSVRGPSTRIEQLAIEPAATFELELLQVVSILVDELRDQPGQPANVEPHPLALELGELGDEPAAVRFRAGLIPALLARGWTLSLTSDPGIARVCLKDAGGTAHVSVARSGRSCDDPERSSGRFALGEADQAFAIEAAAALVDHGLADTSLAAEDAREQDARHFDAEAREAFGPPPPAGDEVDEAPARASRAAFELRPEFDLLVRHAALEEGDLALDPMPRVAAWIGRMPGVAGRLGAAFAPTRGPAQSRALDSFVGAGFGWRHDFARRGIVEVGGLAGVQLHRYRAGQPASPATSSDRFSPSPWTELDFGLGWQLSPMTGLMLSLRAGTSFETGWVHFVDYRRFQRSGWYVAFGLTMSLSSGWRV